MTGRDIPVATPTLWLVFSSADFCLTRLRFSAAGFSHHTFVKFSEDDVTHALSSRFGSFSAVERAVTHSWGLSVFQIRVWDRRGDRRSEPRQLRSVSSVLATAERDGVMGLRLLISPGQLLPCRSSFTPGSLHFHSGLSQLDFHSWTTETYLASYVIDSGIWSEVRNAVFMEINPRSRRSSARTRHCFQSSVQAKADSL